MSARRRALLAFVLCAGMVAYEPLLSLGEQGLRAAFVHFAADAFYYLALVEGWTRAGVPSYDGIHATNGFHPLWLGVLKLATSSLGTQANETIALTFGLSIALLSVGVGLYALAVLRLTRSLALTLICAAPGLYVLLDAQRCTLQRGTNVLPFRAGHSFRWAAGARLRHCGGVAPLRR